MDKLNAKNFYLKKTFISFEAKLPLVLPGLGFDSSFLTWVDSICRLNTSLKKFVCLNWCIVDAAVVIEVDIKFDDRKKAIKVKIQSEI